MLRRIDATIVNPNNTNINLINQNSKHLNPVSFSANISKAPKPMSKFFSIPLRIGEEIRDGLGRLFRRTQTKIDREFGKVPDDAKELVARIKQILGDDQEVHITKKTVLTMYPTLTPKEIIEKHLNESFSPETLKNNARILKEIADGKELPITGKPFIT